VISTGKSISRTDISVLLCNITGRINGIKIATAKLFSINEKATNSTFFLFKLVITGAAIAVGAIAVMNAVWASSSLNGLIIKYISDAEKIIVNRIIKCFPVIISRLALISRNEKKSITINRYRIKKVYSCPYGKMIPAVIVNRRRIVFIESAILSGKLIKEFESVQ